MFQIIMDSRRPVCFKSGRTPFMDKGRGDG